MRYFSPRQLGRAIGASESSVKRWIDAGKLPVSRTAGGHRRVSLADAVAYLRKTGHPVADPAALELMAGEVLAGRADADQIISALFDLLEAGQEQAFCDALCQLYVDGRALSWILDVPLQGAMAKIGELWHSQGDGIGIEHRAMEICSRAVNELRAMVPVSDGRGPWAVGGAPPGDPYLLPSRCAASVLTEAGWQTANLGADVPWDQFGVMARRHEAKLVWLSVTGQPEAGLSGRIEALAGDLAQLGAMLVVGGRSLPDTPVSAGGSNLHVVADMAGLAAFAEGQRRKFSPSSGNGSIR